MRKLKLQVQTSVDGFMATPTGELNFVESAWDDALGLYVWGLMEPVDCIVLGRVLAEGFIPYWATVAADADHPEASSGIFFSKTPKVVFSHTLEESVWDQTTLATGDLVTEVNALKQQDGGDIIAYGGAEFVSSLVANDLIDEFHLFVNPVAIGRGLPVFGQLEAHKHLTLVQATPFACGIVVLRYEPRREG